MAYLLTRPQHLQLNHWQNFLIMRQLCNWSWFALPHWRRVVNVIFSSLFHALCKTKKTFLNEEGYPLRLWAVPINQLRDKLPQFTSFTISCPHLPALQVKASQWSISTCPHKRHRLLKTKRFQNVQISKPFTKGSAFLGALVWKIARQRSIKIMWTELHLCTNLL